VLHIPSLILAPSNWIAGWASRIAVPTPGLFPFGLTIEDIQGGASKLRNRVIGRVFKELRLIEQWGSGLQGRPMPAEKPALRSRSWTGSYAVPSASGCAPADPPCPEAPTRTERAHETGRRARRR